MHDDRRIDLYGFGIAAVDDLLDVAAFPQPGHKIEVRSTRRQGGGLCATALVAAARLGARCLYGGLLGRNELSDFTRRALQDAGVEVVEEIAYPEAEPFHSVIVVDRATGERTILYSRERVIEPRREHVNADRIRTSRALFVDHFGPEGVLDACEIARGSGTTVIADIESVEDHAVLKALPLINHLIVPLRLGQEATGRRDPETVVRSLASAPRACSAVTDGIRGCWFVEGGEPAKVCHQPAFKVEVVDTTGCGDVFHGAYAAALLSGMPVCDSIRFASAAAAIKATRPGGQLGIPDRPTVETFLKRAE